MDKQTQLNKLNEYVKKSENSFVNEAFDYISDNALDYTSLLECINDVLKDPNGLLLTDNEYVELYDKFEDEILNCVDDFNMMFKKLPTIKEYKVTLAKYAIECVLINFIDVINE